MLTVISESEYVFDFSGIGLNIYSQSFVTGIYILYYIYSIPYYILVYMPGGRGGGTLVVFSRDGIRIWIIIKIILNEEKPDYIVKI